MAWNRNYGSPDADQDDAATHSNGKVVKTYLYRDAYGRVVIEEDRLENLMDGKWFVPRWNNPTKPQDREKGERDWYYKNDWPEEFGPVPMVLYRLPELLEADESVPVYLCEGSKDADNVAALGLVATTNVCGATAWITAYNEVFRNRHVVILEDNDPKGQQRTRLLKQNLSGIAASLKVVQFPELPAKGDVSDWLALGKSKEDLLAYIESYKPKERFNIAWADLLKPDAVKKRSVVKGFIAEGEFTLISGLPGCGKSVVATDAACHVAAGVDWHGKAVERGLVIYFAAERKSLTERRVLAWREEHGIKDDMPLAIVNGPLAFAEKPEDDAQALVEAIKEAEQVAGLPCVWIVLDTLTRTYGAGDQNASKDMTKYVKAIDALLHGTGAHVTVIHHTTWDGQRGKGAIDLDGAVDASFLVKKTGDSYCLACDGANDMDEGPILHYRLASRDFGRDEETGEPIGAPVVKSIEPPTEVDHLIKGAASAVFNALKAAIAAGSKDVPGKDGMHGCLVSDWREMHKKMDASGQKPDTISRAFRRQKDRLLSAKAIEISGEYAWIPEQDNSVPF